MPLTLHKIKPSANSQKSRKRIGRGNGSGLGTYSGRGLKGQKARSGVSNLKRLGMRQVLLRTPKNRGFQSLKEKSQVVNLSALNEFYKDGETVNVSTLLAKKLISGAKRGVKILGQGDLKVSSLKFEGVAVSASAKEQIERMKGKISS